MARLTSSSIVKIVLIIALAFVLMGVVGIGSCSSWRFVMGSGTDQVGSAEVDASNIDSIDISWAAGSVTVSVSDEVDTVLINETTTGGLTRVQEMRWSVSGGKLKIDYGGWFSCFSLSAKDLNVQIPRSLAENMTDFVLDGASGDYFVDGITSETFKVSLASGRLDASNIVTKSAKLDAASGNLKLNGEITDSLKVDIASGDIEVVLQEVVPSSIKTDLASGTIILSLPENNGFTAKIDSLSGNFESAFDTRRTDENTYVYQDGSASIDADMASGNLILRRH